MHGDRAATVDFAEMGNFESCCHRIRGMAFPPLYRGGSANVISGCGRSVRPIHAAAECPAAGGPAPMPAAISAEADQPVVQNNRPRHSDIDGESRGNLHHDSQRFNTSSDRDIRSAPNTYAAPLRVTEARKFHGIVGDLTPTSLHPTGRRNSSADRNA